MYDERINKIIEENPKMEGLRRIAEDGLVLISPDFEKYLDDPNQLQLNDRTISRQLIVDILTHDDTFDKIKRIYENDLSEFIIMFRGEKGESKKQYNTNKMQIIDILKQIDLQEVPSIIDRYNQIMDYVSYEKYKEKTQNDNYEITIEGTTYQIPLLSIYQFLDLDDEDFKNIMENNNIFNNMPLSHFLYAINKYFEDNGILNNYLVDDKLKERLKGIESSEKVDIQMLNQYLDINDSSLKQIKVNAELQDLILSDIPPNFDNLEKAIYIYIKMCKVLTYDEEFYAVNQKGPLTEKHKMIDNISNISPDNNKVVCYEFDAIYSYFLHKLGINYKHFVNKENREREFSKSLDSYSEGHTFLKFRFGKYLVKADSVTSILDGDIIQAKLNQPLVGLICENINEQTKKDFSSAVHKVYSYIAEKEPKVTQNDVEEVESFEEIVSQFVSKTDKLDHIDVREKVDILIDKVNSTKMIGIDAYSYLLQLRKILFTPQEQKNNIKISIIRNSDENSAKALSIISTRLPDENDKMIINRYIFRPGSKLIPILREKLQENFDNSTMGYVGDNDPEIPGIKK